MGMLAWFVNGFVKQNALTPDSILILFIVSVLALAWAIFTLFSYHRSSTNAHFVAFVDALFFGAFIAAVYYLRYVATPTVLAFNVATTGISPLAMSGSLAPAMTSSTTSPAPCSRPAGHLAS